MPLTFSFLIPHHRDVKVLKRLIDTILMDPLYIRTDKIVIVSPKKLNLQKSKKLMIIKESKREGKSRAIRKGLKTINSPIVIMLTADIKIKRNFIKYIIKHFYYKNVGVVTGKPMADKNSKIYFLSKIIWELHDEIQKITPKGTEIIAFRNIIKDFPDVNADEVYIEYFFKKNGYQIVYEPNASGYTESPNGIYEFFKQRKRIFIGHLHIKDVYGYETSTMNLKNALRIFIKKLSFKQFPEYILIAFLEMLARILGFFQYKITRNPLLIW